MTLFLELVGVGVLILLNGFFVAAEYALVTVRRTRLQELAEEGHRRARAVQRITADPPRFIAAMQLGVTLTSLGIGALGEPVLSHVLDDWIAAFVAALIAFVVITFMHVVVGELVPEGPGPRVLRPDRAGGVRPRSGLLHRLQAGDLGAPALE